MGPMPARIGTPAFFTAWERAMMQPSLLDRATPRLFGAKTPGRPRCATPGLPVDPYDGVRKSVVSGSVQSGRSGVESVSSSSARLSAARS